MLHPLPYEVATLFGYYVAAYCKRRLIYSLLMKGR